MVGALSPALNLAEHGPAYAGELGEPFERVTATGSQFAKAASDFNGEIHVLSVLFRCARIGGMCEGSVLAPVSRADLVLMLRLHSATLGRQRG
jgi:hypothetical protein